MRFIMFYKPSSTAPPSQETIEGVNSSIEEAQAAGELLASEGLHPISKGARVRLSAGVVTVVDGPYAEAKEMVGGYAIFELKSREEAIERAKGFLKMCGDGEVEIRQMFDHTESATGS